MLERESHRVLSYVVVVLLATMAVGCGARTMRADQLAAPASVPPAYLIGPEDVLNIVFWGEPNMSTETVVRPDGKISLPLISEVTAAGITPYQLQIGLMAAAKRFIADPNVTVVVRQINSRKAFITGNVERPGHYPLNGPTTALQLIATAGGLREFADAENIRILRSDNEKVVVLRVNYNDLAEGKNLQQNIVLRPGDTVVVP